MRMGDGPVRNLPWGLDAYGGYVNDSGIGPTYWAIVARFTQAVHFSITTNGSLAQCADVESGAMSEWSGYAYGYCEVSQVNELVARYGRPRKLWTAHRDPRYGAHLCSPNCWPGLVTTADGTQWTDHGGLWDESLLAPDFFSLYPNQPVPAPPGGKSVATVPNPITPSTDPAVGGAECPTGGYWVVTRDGGVYSFGCEFYGSAAGHPQVTAIVGMSATPTGKGYALFDASGGVFNFGDSADHGSARA